MSRKNRILLVLGVGVSVILLIAFAFPRLKPHNFFGTIIQSPDKASDFTLLTTNNAEVRLSDFSGKEVVLYFGYTFCPDVCPTTMVELKNAMDLLGDDAKEVQVIMVSVDPERDTPDKIATYATHFHPSFLGVTGTLEEVSRLATLYGIYFAKSEGSDLTGYLIDHTATVIVVNQEGNVKLLFPYGTTGEEFAADLEYLIHH